MKDSQVTLYEHNAIGENSSMSKMIIVVLGFFGIFKDEKVAKKILAKKYGHLGEKFGIDVMGITFPWTFMYFEESMRQWVEARLDSYFQAKPEKKSIILLVSSGGGTVMFPHFLKWLNKNNSSSLKAIMWEYSPGSISISEFFRAASTTINPQNKFFMKMLLYPSVYPTIAASCKICDMLTDYSTRVRTAPWTPDLIPESVSVEYSIANHEDPIMHYSYVIRWIIEMRSLGREINHYPIQAKGHLNAMKAYPERYLQIWDKFMDESCA